MGWATMRMMRAEVLSSNSGDQRGVETLVWDLALHGVGDSLDRQLSVISVIFCSNPSQQFHTDVTGRTNTSHM